MEPLWSIELVPGSTVELLYWGSTWWRNGLLPHDEAAAVELFASLRSTTALVLEAMQRLPHTDGHFKIGIDELAEVVECSPEEAWQSLVLLDGMWIFVEPGAADTGQPRRKQRVVVIISMFTVSTTAPPVRVQCVIPRREYLSTLVGLLAGRNT